MKKRLFIWPTILLLLLLCFVETTENNAFADSSIDALEDVIRGLQSAPDNLGLKDKNGNVLFVPGDFSGYSGNPTNKALLLNSSASTTGDLRAIRMTGYKNETAAMWSNVANNNYIDLGQNQTLSMWLYFGKARVTPADGMAFVMQNSDAGIKAFSNKNGSIAGGETLGTWAVDNDRDVSSNVDLAKTAIQNSWALEFDTHVNNSATPGAADYFDSGSNITGQHIAYGEPGNFLTYNRQGTKPSYFMGTYLSGGYYYSMAHGETQNTNFTNGQWHHLTLHWYATPGDQHITYSFDDKNPDGSKGTDPKSATVPVDTSLFGTVPNNKLRWGFTATTGDYYEPNLVAFESIPSLVEGDITSRIDDLTQDKTVETNGTVNSGDKLGVNYLLKYQSGNEDWSNIQAKLILPSYVTYPTTGNVGTITYSDGTIENIPASSLSGNTLTYTLSKSLSSSLNSATITINGVANGVSASTKVPSVRSHFTSDDLIKDVDTVPFVINKAKPINLSLDQTQITVKNDEAANVTGQVTYTDGSTVTNSKVNVYGILNGTKLTTVSLGSSGTDGKLNYSVPYSQLTQEKNTLQIYVKDSDGNVSNTGTVIISKQGTLSLNVGNYSFKTINTGFANGLIPRTGAWNVSVSDARAQGSQWKLTATNDGLYQNSLKFAGNLIFRKSDNTEQDFSATTPVQIAQGAKTTSGIQVTQISDNWNSATGILLKSTGKSVKGAYTGKVNWILNDSV